MRSRFRMIGTILGVTVALGLAVAVGYLAADSATQTASQGASTASYGYADKGVAQLGAPETAPDSFASVDEQRVVDPTNSGSANSPAPNAATQLVVTTAAMALRVAELDKAVASVRLIAEESGSQIANLSIYTGEPAPLPVPLAGQDGVEQPTGPGTADITLRVPAAQLKKVEKAVAALGTVLTQSASEDDVTQQHVDLEARLKNLRAEEVRLRAFLDDATKVSEMLAVEQELSRVRGEIESMQAQLTYLERQAAMATLAISLSEPGSVVSPGTQGWGIADAVTRGIRAAAALVTASITVLIAAIPLLVIVALILIARWLVRRRRHDASNTSVPPIE